MQPSKEDQFWGEFHFSLGRQGMLWSEGAIGWQASTSLYGSHYLSGQSNSRPRPRDVGCLYSSSYSAIAY